MYHIVVKRENIVRDSLKICGIVFLECHEVLSNEIDSNLKYQELLHLSDSLVVYFFCFIIYK